MTNDSKREGLSESEAGPIFITLIGDFHFSFTSMEHELACAVFAAVTRMSPHQSDVALAILGSQRMASLKDTIKRLLRATKASARRIAFVDAIFLQLGEIQFFRDRVTHYITVMSDYDPECWVNMNYTGIREPHLMEDLHFNLFAIHAAAADLKEMRQFVALFFNHHLKGGSRKLPTLPAWQYKPSMLVRNRPISRENRQRPKRQRKPRGEEV